MDGEEKKRGGRPEGRRYPHRRDTYLGDEELRLLELVERERGMGHAALLRQLIREEARRLGHA